MDDLGPELRLPFGMIPELKWLKTMIMERALTRGEVLMAGGKRSDYYIDKFRLFSDPTVLRRIARMFVPIVSELSPDLIAGTVQFHTLDNLVSGQVPNNVIALSVGVRIGGVSDLKCKPGQRKAGILGASTDPQDALVVDDHRGFTKAARDAGAE